MKKIPLGTMLSILITVVGLHADVSMNSPETPEYPTVRPPIDSNRPIRPKPIIRPALLYGEHYHTYITTTQCDCAEYIKIIKEKNAKIEALLKENAQLKEEAQKSLQKILKEEYDTQLKKFEERGQ